MHELWTSTKNVVEPKRETRRMIVEEKNVDIRRMLFFVRQNSKRANLT